MSEFIDLCDAQQTTASNALHLENLHHVVVAHQLVGRELMPSEERRLERCAQDSGDSSNKSVKINRPIERVLEPYRISVDTLQTFAANGKVVDYGCGRSNFLDHFGESETVAIDTARKNLRYQRKRGHEAYYSTDDIETESVRLLNASYSLPFWSHSIAHARTALNEYARILEGGGMGLIGPVVSGTLARSWEAAVLDQKYPSTQTEPRKPWGAERFAAHSIVLATFLDELLQMSSEYLGGLEVAPFRSPSMSACLAEEVEAEVPDYLIVRKAA